MDDGRTDGQTAAINNAALLAGPYNKMFYRYEILATTENVAEVNQRQNT